MTALKLSCDNLCLSYGQHKVLKGVQFDLQGGEVLAVMGFSGSGKSSLLRCLNFITQPDQGRAELGDQLYMDKGQPLFAPSEIRSQIGLVFQNYNLFPNLTCLRNITLGLEKVKGWGPARARTRAYEVSEDLGIAELLERYPDTLSGGQAQRLALARALVLEPSVLLLDEITSALDPVAIAKTLEAIRKVRAYGDFTVIVVTHLVGFAVEFATTIAFLHEGRFVEYWPAARFKTECSNEAALEFLNLGLSQNG